MANFKKYINNKKIKKIKVFMKNHHKEIVNGNLLIPSCKLLLKKNTKATLDYKNATFDKDYPHRLRLLLELKNSKLTKLKNNEQYFIEDIIFDSPTSASNAILGRQTNLQEWTILSSGKKLNKDLLNQIKSNTQTKWIEEEEEKAQYNFDKEKLEKQTQTNTRGYPFKKWSRLLKEVHDYKCAVCKIDNPKLLVSSHILPWKKSDDDQKVDLNNGLVLCRLHDKMFEDGAIVFQPNSYLDCIKVINNYSKYNFDQEIKSIKLPSSYDESEVMKYMEYRIKTFKPKMEY